MASWLARVAASPIPALCLTLASCNGGNTPENPAGSAGPPPLADFSAAPTQGIAPLQVSFINLSTNSSSWLWEFGDGSVSTEQDPVHVYAAADVYTVRLTAVGQSGTAVHEAKDLVQTDDAVGDGSFENQTAGSPPAAPWEIVAGASHIIQPLPGVFGDHGMPSAGALWCELSSEGSDPSTATQVVGIQQAIHPPLGAFVLQFEAAFIDGDPDPGFIDFMRIEVSDGATTEVLYARDAASGMLSTSAVHSAPMTPVETVTADLAALFPGSNSDTPFVLRALIGNGGDGQFPSFGYVDNLRFRAAADVPIQASFGADITTAGIGSVIQFTDTSTGSPTAWDWDFGDGTASIEQNPVHSYTVESTYTVGLRATAVGAGDLHVAQDFIKIDNSQCEQGNLQIVSPAGACAVTGTTFTFQNDSINGTSFLWDFGVGTTLPTASTANVTHNYNTPGTFAVTVTAFGQCFGATGKKSSPKNAQVVDAPNAGSLDIVMTFPFGTNVTCKPPGFSSFANEAAYRNETVRFIASNSNPGANPLSFSWNFGDGGTGNGAIVDHVYTSVTSGNNKRTVILNASNCAGSAQISRTIKIAQLGSTALGYLNGGGVQKCAGCHSGGAPSGGLDLTPGLAFSQLVNVNMNCTSGGFTKRVNIGCGGSANSAVSGLIHAMGSPICSQASSMLSLCGSCVNSTQFDELVDWIDFGAPNN